MLAPTLFVPVQHPLQSFSFVTTPSQSMMCTPTTTVPLQRIMCMPTMLYQNWPPTLQQSFQQYSMMPSCKELEQRISKLLGIWPNTLHGLAWLVELSQPLVETTNPIPVLKNPILELAKSPWWENICYGGFDIHPRWDQIFNFARYCSPREVKVVIVGQDPYPNEKAHGLAFSVLKGPIPPSLNNMFKLLEKTIDGFIRNAGDLTNWAEQGVLLLNSVLTYPGDNAKFNYHVGQGCEIFTDAVIKYISDYNQNVVFMLWGKYALKKAELINEKKHLVLTASHPSSRCWRSKNTLFKNCNHFQQSNNYLGERDDYWYLE